MPKRNEGEPEALTPSRSKRTKASQVGIALADPSAIEWAVSFVERFEKPGQKFATLHGSEKQPDGSHTFPF
jgi:hypothetical protein